MKNQVAITSPDFDVEGVVCRARIEWLPYSTAPRAALIISQLEDTFDAVEIEFKAVPVKERDESSSSTASANVKSGETVPDRISVSGLPDDDLQVHFFVRVKVCLFLL